jgi:hypothetical protein
MSYSEFVKKHYEMVKHLPSKDRFKAIAEMYHAQKGDEKPKHSKAKGSKARGGMAVAGSLDFPPFLQDMKMVGEGGRLSMPKKHSKSKGGILVGGSEVPFHGSMSAGVPKKHGKARGGLIVAGSLDMSSPPVSPMSGYTFQF